MNAEEKTKKPRPVWMKKGSYKYLLQLLHGLKRDLSDLRKTQRYMAKGLQHEFFFDEDYICDIACRDEIDQAILNQLKHSPASGILPRDIAHEVQCGVTPWQVTLRIRRMNKRLDRQIGQRIAEKRGLRWSLTGFIEASWE